MTRTTTIFVATLIVGVLLLTTPPSIPAAYVPQAGEVAVVNDLAPTPDGFCGGTASIHYALLSLDKPIEFEIQTNADCGLLVIARSPALYDGDLIQAMGQYRATAQAVAHHGGMHKSYEILKVVADFLVAPDVCPIAQYHEADPDKFTAFYDKDPGDPALSTTWTRGVATFEWEDPDNAVCATHVKYPWAPEDGWKPTYYLSAGTTDNSEPVCHYWESYWQKDEFVATCRVDPGDITWPATTYELGLVEAGTIGVFTRPP